MVTEYCTEWTWIYLFNLFLWHATALITKNRLLTTTIAFVCLEIKICLPSSRTGGVCVEPAGGDQSSHGTDGSHSPLLTGDQTLHVLLLGPAEAHRLPPHRPGDGPPELRLEEEEVEEDEN